MQAKSVPPEWQFYPQSIDSKAYPHGVPGIAFAALFGLATIVEAMLDNETNRDDDEEALFWAATGGSAAVAKLLLARGISPNVPGAIRAAAENGHENVICILIANSGDINAKGREDDGNAL
jgi:ankyrin repeat protein